ncbi:MAG: AbrB/MazE/SpoVT family DNA-binding domain-containing protein [Pseudomonadota bacterium]
MQTVKLSSKGQIVIPKSIRDALHLPPGTEFVVIQTAIGLTLTPTTLFPRVTTAQVRGFLFKSGRNVPTDGEIKARIKARLQLQDDASKQGKRK